MYHIFVSLACCVLIFHFINVAWGAFTILFAINEYAASYPVSVFMSVIF